MIDSLAFLSGGGEAARMIRARDWVDHPLGAPETWSEALRVALGLVLNSPESMILAWGPDLHFFFNDAYFPLLGPRLSWAMGERFDKVWADGWEQAKPIIEQAMAGNARRFIDLPWTLDTDRGAKDTWWSFSYSRVLDGQGKIAGLFIFTNETTDRVIADRTLRDREARYRTLFDSIDEGFCIIEFFDGPHGPLSDYVHVEANAAYTRHAGIANVVGQKVREMVPDEADGWVELYRTVLCTGEPIRFERELVATHRHLELAAFRIEPPSRKQVAVLFQDITARKRAERALASEAQRQRLSLQQMPGFVGLLSGPDHVYQYVNDAYLKIAGARNFLGRTVRDVFPELEDQGFFKLLDEVYASGESFSATAMPIQLAREDGERFIDLLYQPIRDDDGAVSGIFVGGYDVTERVRAERALAALNESLQSQVEARTRERDRMWTLSRDLFLVIDADGIYKAVNPTWERDLGYPSDQLIGSRHDELVHPDDLPAVFAAFAQLSGGSPTVDLECRLRRADGQYRTITWTGVATESGFYCTGRDVTEQRRTEEALRQSQKMEAVGQLTGGLAHDFNNLLAGISGSLELIGTRISQGRVSEVDRYIVAAQGAARRAAALTHRLLAFSRRQTLDPRATNVNALIGGMEDLIRRTVGPAIDLEVIGASGLWPALVDPPQLESALLNLCINARDAMPDGGRVTIETANRWFDVQTGRLQDLPAGQYLSLCVTDTGTGMPPDVVAKAFDPFFTTKPIGQGTGLGLSMIYGFAQQSGGQVRIYSEVGKGTTVCIYLPRHVGEAEAADPLAALTPPLRAQQAETVLVVDDEPTVRMLVAEVLEDLGYTAIEAADSSAGLKVLQSNVRIDLLVTDVGLPGGMNGRQMADAGRERRPGLKVLFITGYAENAVIGNGHLAPGMQVLTKPFPVDVLASRIQELVGS